MTDYEEEKARNALATMGGVEAVVAALNAHCASESVQHNGCWALVNLANNNDAKKVSIAAKGGIEAVVAALNAHRTSENVQNYGCMALTNLAAINAANQVSIARPRVGSRRLLRR
jgi:hypothetical protein